MEHNPARSPFSVGSLWARTDQEIVPGARARPSSVVRTPLRVQDQGLDTRVKTRC